MSEINIFARFEIKYLINYEQRKMMEREMASRMTPDPHGQSTICNIYYDTPDYRLIRRSNEKPVYKEKLRLRSYGKVSKSDTVFLELKKKYKKIVYKRRIELPENMAVAYIADQIKGSGSLWLDNPRDRQIAKEIDYFKDFYEGLAPRVHLSYDRCAYFSKEDPNLRVTFDRHIRWRNTDLSLTSEPGGFDLLERGYSLMEIKTAAGLPMWMVEILNKGDMKKASFSKYGKAYECILKESIERTGIFDVETLGNAFFQTSSKVPQPSEKEKAKVESFVHGAQSQKASMAEDTSDSIILH